MKKAPAKSANMPALHVECWVQGVDPGDIADQKGRVTLVEVFQVNCPGCFIGGFPELMQVMEKFRGSPLNIWGIATAFEDYDKNNLENLQKLARDGEVVGETRDWFERENRLKNGRLPYRIPFPLAMDKIVARDPGEDEQEIERLIARDLPNFHLIPEQDQQRIRRQVGDYLKNRPPYRAMTFERYNLQGTPSTLIFDKKGNLHGTLFGFGHPLESIVEQLLSSEG